MKTKMPYLLITEFGLESSGIDGAVKSWKKIYKGHSDRVLYKKSENSDLLEIVLVDRPASIESELSSPLRHSYNDTIKPDLRTDWRQQLLGLKNKVVLKEGLLPNTNYLQLRYIEVPLRVYDEYFQWRVGSIFDYVERFPQIEYFTAYHSTLSTKPGVMFLSGFSNDVDKYMSIFNADEFQAISNEAKSKYIYGGDQGLSLTMYEKM